MDYLGSKRKLLNLIFSNLPLCGRFLDACAGSGVVSQHAATLGYDVTANDLMTFSSVIADGSIGYHSFDINYLNYLSPIEGFFHEEFSIKRNYFSKENAAKIDAIRTEAEKYNSKEKPYILYCLMEAMSRVVNSCGTHAAPLKQLKKCALNSIKLNNEKIYPGLVSTHCGGFCELIDKHYNIIYVDPPYNHRNYGTYYHLYETLCRYDNPPLRGKCGYRLDTPSSGWYSVKTIENELKSLLKMNYDVLKLSYSSAGIASHEMICDIIHPVGVDDIVIQPYRSHPGCDREPVIERIYICIRT